MLDCGMKLLRQERRADRGDPLLRLTPAFCGWLVAGTELLDARLGVGLRLARTLDHLHQRLEIVAREQVRALALDVDADRLGLGFRAGDDLCERLARPVEHSQRAQRACESLGINRRLVGWTVRHVQRPPLNVSRVTPRSMLGLACLKSTGHLILSGLLSTALRCAAGSASSISC